MYAPKAIAAIQNMKSNDENNSLTIENRHPLLGDGMDVAEVSDDMSFNEAFSAAREEVGPGGVFYWRGGIYGTYNKEEWESISEEERADFTERANEMIPEPEKDEDAVRPQDVEEMAVAEEKYSKNVDDDSTGDDDVVVVGYGEYDGHLMVGLDTNRNGYADIAVIDVDDDGFLSPDDLVVTDKDTLNDLMEEETDDFNADDTDISDDAADDMTSI